MAFSSRMPMAGNLIDKNGLPTYSEALVEIRQAPLSAAIVNPVAASGTVGAAIAASGARSRDRASADRERGRCRTASRRRGCG